MIQWISCHLTALAHYHQHGWPQVKINLSLAVLRCLEGPRSDEKWNHLNSYVLPDRTTYDLVEWIYRVDVDYSPDRERVSTLVAAHSSTFWCPDEVYEEDIKGAIRKAERLGICKYRLFNLISCCARGDQDLPALLVMIDDTQAATASCFRHQEDFALRDLPAVVSFADSSGAINHESCTADHCEFALLDNTRVAQKHKCGESNIPSCPLIQFPQTPLQTADRLVWKSVELSTASRGAPSLTNGEYIAISHVWSDGTGAGTKGPGAVNSCLFQYFSEVAKALHCEGVWWDTISIPPDPKLRAKALRNMQINFSSAKHTVVHDEYLVNFPWKDDGTPCLALVLSPWFTRGWTAVELISSRSIKVLFKDPNNDRAPLIKDLRKDILASRFHHTLGHRTATRIIRRLQQTNVEPRSMRNLMQNLKSRNNSWPRDRIVVASLLAGVKPDLDAVNMEGRVMQQIITSYPQVDASVLIHGSPTIVDHGPLSWCPLNLFSGSTPILPQNGTWEALRLDIDKGSGSLTGRFWARTLPSLRQNNIEPFSMHSASQRKIMLALQHPGEYLVLTCYRRQRLCLVIKPTRLSRVDDAGRKFIECDWVGVALMDISYDPEGWFPNVKVQIGATSGPPELGLKAEDVLDIYHGQERPSTQQGDYFSLEPIHEGYEWSIQHQRWEKHGAPYLGLSTMH
ncbi:hypothetical protein AYL99_06813 [Fonsecaea erecta]|uniref:Heterokaryon incompatibility domain-containing protein n=1 Tax=Fonsecaea erecta TaxID=1367422 RepID=A0A178ZKF8_9EURO|nr:hypothetical protein AYL99_06813 [Fonsecaea erecta]OAP59515.1 hypothetical protein AYL99_06813 [Fonsecaea erecta]